MVLRKKLSEGTNSFDSPEEVGKVRTVSRDRFSFELSGQGVEAQVTHLHSCPTEFNPVIRPFGRHAVTPVARVGAHVFHRKVYVEVRRF